jgi:phospholipase/carboxylesterase
MNGIDEAFAVWSAPVEERVGRPLVVLLHGRGGNEGDMTQFFDRLPPEYVAVSVRAPFSDGAGSSWFTDVDSERSLARKLDDAGTELLQWIQTPMREHAVVGPISPREPQQLRVRGGARRDAPVVGLIG